MGYVAWNNNERTYTEEVASSQGTTLSTYETDKLAGRFLSPVYIDTQPILSFSRSLNLEFIYINSTGGFVESTVSVGAFNDPSVITTATTEATGTVSLASETGTDIVTRISYAGEFKTFIGGYGRLEDIGTISSFEITARTLPGTVYENSGVITFEQFAESGTVSRSTYDTMASFSLYTVFPTFFGADEAGVFPLYSSSSNNRSWGENEMYIRFSNALFIPNETIISSSYTLENDDETISYESITESYETLSEFFTYYASTSNMEGESFTVMNSTFQSTAVPIIGGNVACEYRATTMDEHWVFFNQNNPPTRVRAFLAPIRLSSYALENIGVASYQSGKIFFPDINQGDALAPRTRYAEPAWAFTNGLEVDISGRSITWKTGRTSTESAIFQTRYLITTSNTTRTVYGNAQIAAPQSPLSIYWNGVFGLTEYGVAFPATELTSSSSTIFTASVNSTTIISATNEFQAGVSYQIMTDGFWMNPADAIGIL
jgi:hypothetical protein